jgi:hypothetical protein
VERIYYLYEATRFWSKDNKELYKIAESLRSAAKYDQSQIDDDGNRKERRKAGRKPNRIHNTAIDMLTKD